MSLRTQLLDMLPLTVRNGLRKTRMVFLSRIRSGGKAVINHRGIRIALNPAMGEGPLRALREGRYEGGELAAIERFLKKTDIVLEMGTGIGFITLFCAKIVGPEKVHSFEANPRLEPLIRRNFELNNLHPYLTFAVLGESEGVVKFKVAREYWSSSRQYCSDDLETINVRQLSVNTVLKRVSPSMIVMDIEGGECELVPMMDFAGVQRIMIELHPQLTGIEPAVKVEKHLRDAGFVERWACPDHVHLLLERD
jgi:FkbM family methyltransferase